ncbi:MAG: hypothetical protein IPM59_01860 [Chloracidobacterium sp.]|nr:hypothetical protein [Chloracidobacterium sp.]
MLFRAIALSLALLIGGATIIPLATELAEAGQRKPKKKKRYWRGVKKYSKRWWQLYRAQERRKKLRAKRRRALRLRQLRLAKARSTQPSRTRDSWRSTGTKVYKPDASPQTVLPSGDPAPAGWRQATVSPTELQFRVDNSSGAQVGSASISVVGPALMPGEYNRKSVGGVATSALRRDVIDRMIRENGWVVNDYQKDIAGQSVYVVVAQSQARNGQVQSRMFYFTEVEGKIYTVATNSPMQEAERLADESEKVINSLKSRVRSTQRASN